MDSDADSEGRPLRRLAPSVFVFCFCLFVVFCCFILLLLLCFIATLAAEGKTKKELKQKDS